MDRNCSFAEVLEHKSLSLWCIFVRETRAAVRLSDYANIQECVYNLQKVHFPAIQ
jgi:hypothetical protein